MVDVVVPQLHSIEEDLAVVVVEALEQLKESGLATARRSHEGSLLPLLYVEVDVPEDWKLSRIVLEVEFLDGNISLNGGDKHL